ncbi:MAG: ATP-dependent zinc metalloprotease FtsH [Actinomycetes bacterium]
MPARSGPEPDPPPKPAAPQPPQWRRWLLPIGVLVMLLLLLGPGLLTRTATEVPYSGFLQQVNAGQVQSVVIDDKGRVTGVTVEGERFTTQLPTALDTGEITDALEAKKVEIKATQSSSSWLAILATLLPFLLIIGFLLWTGRQARRSLVGGLGGMGRSRAKLIETQRPTTRFSDVAGYEGVKQEIGEVVDFLRNPDRYLAAGAVGPRGVIMIGPPGTGKTLLARAVAGEAEVPFLSVTGSAFVEMFVGVGAARVRDMFEEARRRAPSIIFVDELDAIGGRRGAGLGSNEEREQTLNQLLAEMDGFDVTSGVVVLAATNRPEMLDPALLRPGRFDRQVVVPLPNQAERAAILGVHAQGKHLDPDVDLAVVARATPGFSGADLANLINEAAINAVRAGRSVITDGDLDAARDRVLLGRRDSSNALLAEERHAVAVHEAGHALVAALCEHADPVAKVTILPMGVALGVTEQLPEVERHLFSEAHLLDALTVQLGGRAAELVVFGLGSTGAANDLAAATRLATRMIREFGLSPALGPVGYSSGGPQYLGESASSALSRPYSEHTQRIVDAEVSRLLREAEERAVALLRSHRTALTRLTAQLLEQETVDGEAVQAVLANERSGELEDERSRQPLAVRTG